jgi:hypothetical protein
MRIIAKSNLRKFWEANPDAESALTAWVEVVEAADWNNVGEERGRVLMTITNEAEYRAAMAEVSPLFDLGDDRLTEEQFLRVSELVDAIEAYEAMHYPIGPPTDEARAEFAREMRGGVPVAVPA